LLPPPRPQLPLLLALLPPLLPPLRAGQIQLCLEGADSKKLFLMFVLFQVS
jgi:hypothetical protein